MARGMGPPQLRTQVSVHALVETCGSHPSHSSSRGQAASPVLECPTLLPPGAPATPAASPSISPMLLLLAVTTPLGSTCISYVMDATFQARHSRLLELPPACCAAPHTAASGIPALQTQALSCFEAFGSGLVTQCPSACNSVIVRQLPSSSVVRRCCVLLSAPPLLCAEPACPP